VGIFCSFVWELNLISDIKKEHIQGVSENRVLRGTFGPKSDEIIIGWRRLYNEALHNMYSSTNIIRMIKSRRMT
jgi:hypothetical protein